MTGPHPDIGPELRKLAQTVLDRLDPAVRAAAAMAGGRGESPGKCQQVWCPVCALAAVASGEHHPMLDVIAEHSVALLTVIRAIVEGGERQPPEPDGPDGAAVRATPGKYQPIPVTVEE